VIYVYNIYIYILQYIYIYIIIYMIYMCVCVIYIYIYIYYANILYMCLSRLFFGHWTLLPSRQEFNMGCQKLEDCWWKTVSGSQSTCSRFRSMALQTSFIFSTLTLLPVKIYIYREKGIYIYTWLKIGFHSSNVRWQHLRRCTTCCFACSGRGIHGNLLLGNPPSNMTGLALPGGDGRVQGEAAWSSCIIWSVYSYNIYIIYILYI